MNSLIPLLITTCLAVTSFGQNTVGLLSFDKSKQYEGYNLIYPHNQPDVFLLDNCGEIVHSWKDDGTSRPGNTAYILENGDLLKTKRPASVASDPIWAGGGGATVEWVTWENERIWSYTFNDSTGRLHHDIQPMPNGNILMIAWERKSAQEALDAGRNPDLLTDGELWPDMILEVRPVPPDSGEIVWEWHAWDHLVQDYDQTKDNYGSIQDNPGKIDVNYTSNDGRADWLHSNAIDYDEVNDHILLSVPFLSEIWIIDHSTSTGEAASSAGGNSGKGGDLIFRWGNPQVYDRGDSSDQRLFGQHDAKWIDDFVPGRLPEYGSISLFNNNVDGRYSSADILRPLYDMYSAEFAMIDGVYAPRNFDSRYVHPDTTPMISSGLSSMQMLGNGNILVCAGRAGYTFETDLAGGIIWEYRTPLRGGRPVTQGTNLRINDNLTFRMNRYPVNYPAFSDRDLVPSGFIELMPDTEFCDVATSTTGAANENISLIYPNPASSRITIEWDFGGFAIVEFLTLDGRVAHSVPANGGRAYIDIAHLPVGVYLITVDRRATGKAMISR